MLTARRWNQILIALCVILSLALAVTIFKQWKEREELAAQGYSGKVISNFSVTNYADVDSVTSENFKIDENGFIPVSDDGGPLYVDREETAPEEMSQDEIRQEVCNSTRDLMIRRSQDNRYAAFSNIKRLESAIEHDSLRKAVSDVDGFQFDSQAIAKLYVMCQ